MENQINLIQKNDSFTNLMSSYEPVWADVKIFSQELKF